jgi:hypothetical protein
VRRNVSWIAPSILVAVALVSTVVSASATRAVQGETARPSLGGLWQLNRDLSAPAGGAGGEMGAPGGGGRGGRGGGGGMGGPGGGMGRGGGGRGGPGGGPPNQEDMQRMRDVMRELMQPAARLTIVQREDTISFTDDQGRVRKFVANGKDEKHQLDAATIETKSRWKDGTLVIEWETGRGPTVIRSYRVDPSVNQLVIETTMKGGRGPGSGDRPPVTHVYDAVVDAPE